MSSTTPILQFDAVDQFYQALTQDTKLQSVEGLQFLKYVDKVVLSTTPTGGHGNKAIIIRQPRCAKFMWNAGGQAGQDKDYVQMNIICRTVLGKENARDVVNAIRSRIKELLFDQEFLGTGWLMHTKISDSWPSPPTLTSAHNILIYEVWTSVGR